MVTSPLEGTLRCGFKNDCHRTARPYPYNSTMPFGMLFDGWRDIACHHRCLRQRRNDNNIAVMVEFEGFFWRASKRQPTGIQILSTVGIILSLRRNYDPSQTIARHNDGDHCHYFSIAGDANGGK